jgi:hypothetical protein
MRYSLSAAGANAPRQLVAGAIIITATMILSHTPVDSLNKSIKSLFGQQWRKRKN